MENDTVKTYEDSRSFFIERDFEPRGALCDDGGECLAGYNTEDGNHAPAHTQAADQIPEAENFRF